MKKYRIILLLAAFGLITSAFFGGHEYFKPNPDMSLLKEAFRKEASGLLDEFNRDDSLTTGKYLGKVIVIKGTIREIEISGAGYYTIVIGDHGMMSSVRCSIDEHHALDLSLLKTGDIAEVKGIFTGFNKDNTGLLGSDAQFNRCVVVAK